MEVPAHFRGAAMVDGPDGPPLCLAGPGIFPQPGGQEAAQRVDDGGDHFPRSSILTGEIATERLYQSPAILLAAMLVSLMIWNLMQRALRKSEQVRAGQLNDLNKRPTQRPTSYLMMCQLSGTVILRYGNQRFLARNGLKEQGLNYLKAIGFDETIYTTPPPPSKTHRRP